VATADRRAGWSTDALNLPRDGSKRWSRTTARRAGATVVAARSAHGDREQPRTLLV